MKKFSLYFLSILMTTTLTQAAVPAGGISPNDPASAEELLTQELEISGHNWKNAFIFLTTKDKNFVDQECPAKILDTREHKAYSALGHRISRLRAQRSSKGILLIAHYGADIGRSEIDCELIP